MTPAFFAKHESFLNTPLLAIMLMLTFEEYAEIPVSLHEFYRNAYDTLVRRHDALKNQFLRPTHSGCTAEEFKRLFSSFCVLTYSKSAFAFSREQAVDYISSALKQQQLKARPKNIISDLIESICLLQEEGFEISFVHRSFQEYFCALFVSMAPAGFVFKYLENGKFRVYDDVLPMLFGMVPERVEAEWALDAVKNILDTYPKDNEDSDWRYLMDLYPTIRIDLQDGEFHAIILGDSDMSRKISVIRRLYPAHFNGVAHHSMNAQQQKKWKTAIHNALVALEESGEPQLKGYQKSVGGKVSPSRIEMTDLSMTPDFRDFICALYSTNSRESDLRVLRKIQEDQNQRVKGGDKFLKEIFSF